MSNPCDHCPLAKGFPDGDQVLSICGDPIQQCKEFRDRIKSYIDPWLELGRIAALGGGRMVHLSLLEPGQEVNIISSPGPGVSYGGQGQPLLNFVVRISEVGPYGSGIVGSVIRDDYHDEYFESGCTWPIPKDEKIRLFGSCTSISDKNCDGWSPASFKIDAFHNPDVIEVGRAVSIFREPDVAFCGLLAQEVIISSVADPDVVMTMFDTYPDRYRPAVNGPDGID